MFLVKIRAQDLNVNCTVLVPYVSVHVHTYHVDLR